MTKREMQFKVLVVDPSLVENWMFGHAPVGTYTEMPRGADILSIEPSGEHVVLHVLADDASPTEPRIFQMQAVGAVVSGVNLLFLGAVRVEGEEVAVFEQLPLGES